MSGLIKTAIIAVLFVLLGWFIYNKGYHQRELEFQAWVKDQERIALNKHIENEQKLKEVTENAIIKQQEDSIYIGDLISNNDRLQQQADNLRSRLATTNKDADSLKAVATKTAELLGRCEARESGIIADYRNTERIALELKNRLSIYEK